MDIEHIHIGPQPYSRALRAIAAMIEGRESGRACVARITRFPERSGIPGRDRPGPRREQRYSQLADQWPADAQSACTFPMKSGTGGCIRGLHCC